MAKQTFTTGQVLTAAQMTQLQQTAMLGGDANARTASYVLVAGDAGNAITMSSTSATTITVNTGIFAAGDIVTIVNINTGVCTITAGTATVTTSGSLALSANQGGVLRFTSASAAIFLQFATPASGDIEGITTGANSGLTGGVTSGTADLKLNFTAKGQLAVGTGSGTTGFLSVGTNGHTIVADSTETTGLKWAAPTSTTLPAFRAYAGAATSCAVSTWTKINFNTEVFDTDNKFASNRFTPTVAGYYIVTVENGFDVNALVDSSYLAIYKNGVAVAQEYDYNMKYPNMCLSTVLYLDGDDYIEVYMNQTYGTANTNTGEVGSFFAACGIRS